MDLTKYFHTDVKSNVCTFTGDELEVYIPARYGNHGLLRLTDHLAALGIFDMQVNGSETGGLCLPAVVNSLPSKTYPLTIESRNYLVAYYRKNDVFMSNLEVVRNDKLGYLIWREFISLGNLPKFLTYDKFTVLFDMISDVCGIKFPVDHAVFEMLAAHLYRNHKDLSQEYRHSDMREPPVYIELRNVAYGPSMPSAKFIGSYFDVGLNSALVNAATGEATQLESILVS